MSNPWDQPPFPTSGDPDDAITYEGVGRVVSHWESLEFELARLYTLFRGDPDGELLLDPKGYGSGRIFQERLKILNGAAEKFFLSNPAQNFEGGFSRIVNAVLGFADRRNDVAHGTVMPLENNSWVMHRFGKPKGGPPRQFLLVPPLHVVRKHEDGVPKYAYSSAELKTLADNLILLWGGISDYRKALLAHQMKGPPARP